MTEFLCISATFLSGEYHGEEWPPCPARLFQALVAGANTGGYRTSWSEVEPVLRKIEALPSPEVVAKYAVCSDAYRISIPNNDQEKVLTALVSGDYTAAQEASAKLKTTKWIAAWRPQRELGDPDLYYIWNVGNTGVSVDSLQKLTSFLHTLGWGIDMAYADSCLISWEEKQTITCKTGYLHLIPSTRGKTYKVPAKDYLDDLARAHEKYLNRISKQGVAPSTQSTAYRQERYVIRGASYSPSAQFILRRLNDESAYYRVPYSLGLKVAAWMRHAAAEALRQEGYNHDFVNSYVLGHGNGHDNHLAFVPVPNIGTIYPDGAIRRVMIIEPPGSSGEVIELLQLKLSSSTLHQLIENGDGPRKTEPVCALLEAPPENIWRYYTRSSRVWNSVTPVVLHGYNSEHGKFSLKKTEQLLYQALEKAGYPKEWVEEFQFQPAPFWAGTEGALKVRVPEYLKKWPRYHVSVRFREPVTGPVLAGIGKYYGIGLFAAAPEQKA